jgi:thioredoxin-related protein
MKYLLFLFLSLSTLFSADLAWLHDYDEAIKQAKEKNKGVYLFVGADDCRWCDRFKDMTLSKDEVIKRLEEEYVLLYMSRDRHNIPKHFEVKGVPRHYFLTNEGKIIHADRGSREPDGFFSLLDEIELKKSEN